MELEVFFAMRGYPNGYDIIVYDRYTDTLGRLTDEEVEQGLRDKKFVIDKIQLKDNKLDLTKALEFNPDKRKVVYKEIQGKYFKATDYNIVKYQMSKANINDYKTKYGLINITPQVTKKDKIRLVEIDKEYEEFINGSIMIGKDVSFKYEVVKGKCILVEYTGNSTEFNVPSFVEYIASSAFIWCDNPINIKATENLKGIGRTSKHLDKVEIPDSTYVAHESLGGN